jgi:ribonucleoside-diphosphate reductase alpha chain
MLAPRLRPRTIATFATWAHLTLGASNLSTEFRSVVELATQFLVCGTLRAKLPYAKVAETREKNRRLGLGLMGVHEWLIQRGQRYEVGPELRNWLAAYRDVSAMFLARFLMLSALVGLSLNALLHPPAPLASSPGRPPASSRCSPSPTSGATSRTGRTGTTSMSWTAPPRSSSTATATDPDSIESAVDLAADYERRMAFQADVQDYVDQAISSTINLPSWGSPLNNEDTVDEFAETLARYAPRLRGFTCYPDGARGGQPLTSVAYSEAVGKLGEEFREEVVHTDICDLRGGGTCGI